MLRFFFLSWGMKKWMGGVESSFRGHYQGIILGSGVKSGWSKAEVQMEGVVIALVSTIEDERTDVLFE